MRFIDETNISVKGGKGGNGLISWRREKYKPLGGPDGGKGGAGGAVIFKASESETTLNDLDFKKSFIAEDGKPGESNNKAGKDGENLLVSVPVGTQFIIDGKVVADLSNPGSAWLAVRGGRGGRGNSSFVSSRRQAPYIAEEGESGEQLELEVKLKFIADIALVGLPNAGKSTLLSVLSKATPKIGAYPFTTLTPQLGVLGSGLTAADIPGLIEDAHRGKGLGISFLKHIERTKLLIYVIDPAEENSFEILENELNTYSEALREKQKIIFISKCDMADNKDRRDLLVSKLVNKGYTVITGSSHTREGISELTNVIQDSYLNEAA